MPDWRRPDQQPPVDGCLHRASNRPSGSIHSSTDGRFELRVRILDNDDATWPFALYALDHGAACRAWDEDRDERSAAQQRCRRMFATVDALCETLSAFASCDLLNEPFAQSRHPDRVFPLLTKRLQLFHRVAGIVVRAQAAGDANPRGCARETEPRRQRPHVVELRERPDQQILIAAARRSFREREDRFSQRQIAP